MGSEFAVVFYIRCGLYQLSIQEKIAKRASVCVLHTRRLMSSYSNVAKKLNKHRVVISIAHRAHTWGGAPLSLLRLPNVTLVYWVDSTGCCNISTMEVFYGKCKGVGGRENRWVVDAFAAGQHALIGKLRADARHGVGGIAQGMRRFNVRQSCDVDHPNTPLKDI